MTPQQHVVLVGPMGSGKTTIGRLLADRLARPFVDNDVELQQATGRTAAEIARTDGIDALHAREASVLRTSLDERTPAVINAAASTVVDADLRARLRSDTFVVWLTADPKTLAHRTETGSPARPRLAVDGLTLAERQRLERDPLFAEVADLLVATDGSVDTVFAEVIAHLPLGFLPADP